MTIFEVTFKYHLLDGKTSSKTFNSERWWDECHEQNERFIQRNFKDKGIELKYYEVINTANFDVKDFDY
jgi:hypothetical protein